MKLNGRDCLDIAAEENLFLVKKLQGETENIELFKGRIIERYSCLRFEKCLLVVLFLSSRELSDGLEVGRLAEMLVLGEEIVEHPQGGLQVQVDNVFGSRLQVVVDKMTLKGQNMCAKKI